MINTPASDTETEVLANGPLRRDHPVLHPHMRYDDIARAARTENLRAAHEGYSGLEADDEVDELLVEQPLPRRRIEQSLREEREKQDEVLRGWAGL